MPVIWVEEDNGKITRGVSKTPVEGNIRQFGKFVRLETIFEFETEAAAAIFVKRELDKAKREVQKALKGE